MASVETNVSPQQGEIERILWKDCEKAGLEKERSYEEEGRGGGKERGLGETSGIVECLVAMWNPNAV